MIWRNRIRLHKRLSNIMIRFIRFASGFLNLIRNWFPEFRLNHQLLNLLSFSRKLCAQSKTSLSLTFVRPLKPKSDHKRWKIINWPVVKFRISIYVCSICCTRFNNDTIFEPLNLLWNMKVVMGSKAKTSKNY